jgi:hypothetical protein
MSGGHFAQISSLGLANDGEALQLLHSAAEVAKPVMQKRGWKVGHLVEFVPRSDRLLGVNVNRGQQIKIRLRDKRDSRVFFAFESVMDTLLHELVHNTFGRHDKAFYGLLDEVRSEAEEFLLRSFGNIVMSSSLLPRSSQVPKKPGTKQRFPGAGCRLGGVKRRGRGVTQRQLCLDAAERRLRDEYRCSLSEKEEDETVVIVID